MNIKQYCTPLFIIMGLAYTTLFHSVWLFSTQFEIIAGTVSWYLPAGVRLAAFLLLPLRSWPMLLVAEKSIHFLLFHPGGVLDNTAFLSGSVGWYLVHLVISPALICTCVYIFRRHFSPPYFDNVNSTLATLVFGFLISVALGAVFLGRRAIELQSDISLFLPILFDFSLGDFVGIIVLCPLLFVLFTKRYAFNEKGLLWCVVSLWVLLLTLSSYAYSQDVNISYQIKYLAVFPALFLSYRYAVFGSAISCLLIGLTAFVVASQSTLLPIEHQFYILALCISCLILGASMSQSTLLASKLAEQNVELEISVRNAQALATKLVAVQEEERKRLSRDLHDDFGHRIVDLKLQLSLSSNGSDSEVLLSKIDALYGAMKKSLGGLRPPGIDTFPIETVIQRSEMVDTIKRSNIAFSFHVEGTPISFSADQKIHIYRIVQEAVTNSIKHSNANNLSIAITYSNSSAVFTVSDDGDGIPERIIRNYTQQTNAPIDDLPAEAHPTPTLGLLSVTERARLINGSINISDNSPSGTVVRLTLH